MSFTVDDNGKRHFVLDAEAGSLNGAIQPLRKQRKCEIPLGPHLMTREDGVTIAAAGATLTLITPKIVRWFSLDAKTLRIDLGNTAVTLTFGTAAECEQAVEQFRTLVER